MSNGSQQDVYVLVVFDLYEKDLVDEVVGPFSDERDAYKLDQALHYSVPSQVLKLTAPGSERAQKRK